MSFVFPLGHVGNSTQTDLAAQGEGRNLWDVAETEEFHRSLQVGQSLFGLLSQQSLFAGSGIFLPTERTLGMLEQIYAKRQEILKEKANQNKDFLQISPVQTDQYKSSSFNMARASILLIKNEIWAYL